DVEIARQHVNHMALAAPVIGQIARTIFHQAQAVGSEFAHLLAHRSRLALYHRGRNGRPIDDAQGEIVQLHDRSESLSRPGILPAILVRSKCGGSRTPTKLWRTR